MSLAGIIDVLPVTIGVLCLLCGLAVLALGLVALVDRRVKRGGIATLVGAAITAAGMGLVGLFG